MKSMAIKLAISPVIAYFTYLAALICVFEMSIDWNAFSVSIEVLRRLGSKEGIQSLKLMTFVPLGAGFFILVASVFFSLLPSSLKGDYGRARFAKISELSKLDLNRKSGLALAKWKGKAIRFSLSRTCLIVAPPGSGKSAGIAIPNLLSVKNSMVVLDIKGELLEKTAGYRQKALGNEIFVFDPMGDKNTMKFNPFDEKCVKELNFTQKKRLVEEVANTIFIPEKGKDPNDFWLSSAKQLFVFFALYDLCIKGRSCFGDLAQAIQKDYFDELEGDFQKQCTYDDEETQTVKRDPNADTLRAFFSQVSLKKYSHLDLHGTSIEEFILVQNQARTYASSPKETFGGFVANYMNYLNVFTNPSVAQATSSMSFDYQDLRKEKITLYVTIEQTDVDTLAPLIRILLESIVKNLLTGQEVSDPNKYVYFMLDEFIRFGKMNAVIRMPELCRSYGTIPIFITQSYQQIEVTYSRQDVDILLANSHYQVVFRMNSFKDAEEVSKTIGDFTRKKESVSASNMKFVENNKSVSQEGYKLLTPQDVMNQDKSKVLILVSGHKHTPLQAEINNYYEDEKLLEASKVIYKPRVQSSNRFDRV